MAERREYRRRERTTVIAVRLELELETGGFTYQKWGGPQRCKAGDWIVNNAGEVYTIDADSFSKTYRQVGQGVYEKVSRVWAERAEEAGSIPTKEGRTAYKVGDMLVFNDADGEDGYAVPAEKFDSMYKPADS